ncbi:tetratricopeptide repeat protein [Pelagerythrobacter marensis]|uniref:Putative UDP-N-acetylglucosamine--peptide N-acetylglucosaminyltransferase SEC n=1 Tax=Pelagerythrobacter marensis TaxID=543877 RepID=A0A0G3XCW5_9SPHN|nr:tetratricopeptide repeat protein [Pelagerythrobacter marensis]AKM08476.1 Putative UDP-N-acetylglucosamine--peptide N-acetylglucosaminyltransferase SEC [Pelagerythrobacter marensis]
MQAPSQPAQDTLLSDAMNLARSGKLDDAARKLRRVLGENPNQPDALQLLGMVARQRNDHDQAIELFNRSLAARPDQPHVLNNLGNSLLDLGRPFDASEAYREALRQVPTYDDARINLALSLIRLDLLDEAERTVRPLLDRRPINGRAWAAVGEIRSAAGHHARAVTAYRTALETSPGHLPWLHNLAVALRQIGRAREALPILLDCAAKSPAQAKIPYNLGHCLQDLGRFDEAAEAYRHAIRLTPTDADIHESLSRMLWHQGKSGDHLRSYREALASHPGHPRLLAGLARRLILAGEPGEAAALLSPAVAQTIGGTDLQSLLAQAQWSSGQPDRAVQTFDAALKLDPDHAPTLREYARALVILERYGDALPRIERRLAADPFDQQALALQAIAWRLTGDGRTRWLEDPALIRTFQLKPATGDAGSFNSDLGRALQALHGGRNAPLEQTLRGGTQTSDDLFSRDIREIEAVRTMIEDAVMQYIADLPDDPAHPFLRRKGSGFSFSGSWSARLDAGGHHTNHIHPAGWISAVYYVAVPPEMNDREGWLKFGETGLHLGANERILRTIRPEPGMLVLFPSYFYHGTIPFSAEAHRLTIAFDAVPADAHPQ